MGVLNATGLLKSAHVILNVNPTVIVLL